MTIVLTIEFQLNERGEADIKDNSTEIDAFVAEIAQSAKTELSEFVEDAKCTITLK